MVLLERSVEMRARAATTNGEIDGIESFYLNLLRWSFMIGPSITFMKQTVTWSLVVKSILRFWVSYVMIHALAIV